MEKCKSSLGHQQIHDVVSIKLLRRERFSSMICGEGLFYCSIDSEHVVSCSDEIETCFFFTCCYKNGAAFWSLATEKCKASCLTFSLMQCCKAGTGTAGTVTFCLSGTGTGIHYGSGFGSGSDSGTGFGSGSDIKCNKKVEKNKYWEANFLGNKLLWHWKGKILCYYFVFRKLCKILSGSGTGAETRTKTFSKSEFRHRSCNKSLRFHNTALMKSKSFM